MTESVLVTGGAGFIGSNLVRLLVESGDYHVINLDKLTYAGHLASLDHLSQDQRHHFVQGDIADRALLQQLLAEHCPTAVLHLAAESHVDRSVDDPEPFVKTNVVGTQSLLEVCRRYWMGLDAEAKPRFRLLSVSTDEVYGSLGEQGRFAETSPYDPSSPYAASKAAADHMARAYYRTYGLPVIVTNCCNNYGPYQFPEKLIPLMIIRAVGGQALPVYGQGINVRDWLYVEDHCRALLTVLRKGVVGETYNIGANEERQNIEVVTLICDLLDDLCPPASRTVEVSRYRELITYINDRPGHDFRYAIDACRIQRELGWRAQETFASGLNKTVRWYLEHDDWVQRVTCGSYAGWIDHNYGDRLKE